MSWNVAQRHTVSASGKTPPAGLSWCGADPWTRMVHLINCCPMAACRWKIPANTLTLSAGGRVQPDSAKLLSLVNGEKDHWGQTFFHEMALFNSCRSSILSLPGRYARPAGQPARNRPRGRRALQPSEDIQGGIH